MAWCSQITRLDGLWKGVHIPTRKNAAFEIWSDFTFTFTEIQQNDIKKENGDKKRKDGKHALSRKSTHRLCATGKISKKKIVCETTKLGSPKKIFFFKLNGVFDAGSNCFEIYKIKKNSKVSRIRCDPRFVYRGKFNIANLTMEGRSDFAILRLALQVERDNNQTIASFFTDGLDCFPYGILDRLCPGNIFEFLSFKTSKRKQILEEIHRIEDTSTPKSANSTAPTPTPPISPLELDMGKNRPCPNSSSKRRSRNKVNTLSHSARTINGYPTNSCMKTMKVTQPVANAVARKNTNSSSKNISSVFSSNTIATISTNFNSTGGIANSCRNRKTDQIPYNTSIPTPSVPTRNSNRCTNSKKSPHATPIITSTPRNKSLTDRILVDSKTANTTKHIIPNTMTNTVSTIVPTDGFSIGMPFSTMPCSSNSYLRVANLPSTNFNNNSNISNMTNNHLNQYTHYRQFNVDQHQNDLYHRSYHESPHKSHRSIRYSHDSTIDHNHNQKHNYNHNHHHNRKHHYNHNHNHNYNYNHNPNQDQNQIHHRQQLNLKPQRNHSHHNSQNNHHCHQPHHYHNQLHQHYHHHRQKHTQYHSQQHPQHQFHNIHHHGHHSVHANYQHSHSHNHIERHNNYLYNNQHHNNHNTNHQNNGHPYIGANTKRINDITIISQMKSDRENLGQDEQERKLHFSLEKENYLQANLQRISELRQQLPKISFTHESVVTGSKKKFQNKIKQKKKSRKKKNKRPSVDLAAKLSEENRKGIVHVHLTTMPSYLVLPLHEREEYKRKVEQNRQIKKSSTSKKQLDYTEMYPYFSPKQLQVVKPDDDLKARAKAAKSTVLKRSLKGNPHLNPLVESNEPVDKKKNNCNLVAPDN